MSLSDLPTDVVLLLLQQCNISSLHAMRQTCHGLYDIIAVNIGTIAPGVARATFPVIPRRVLELSGAAHDFHWLDELRFRWMAAALIEHPNRRYQRFKFPGHNINEWLWKIPSDHPAGDHVRESVTLGLRTLLQLHLIDRNIDRYDDLPSNDPAILSVVSGLSRKLSLATATLAGDNHRLARVAVPRSIEKREGKIVHYRLQLINQLSIEALEGFNMLITLLASTGGWVTPETWGIRYWADAVDGGFCDESRHLTKGRSWLFWYVMHIGPQPFLRQWLATYDASEEVRHVKIHCNNIIRKRSMSQIGMERDAGQRVSKAIALRLPSGLDVHTAIYPIHEASESIKGLGPGHLNFELSDLDTRASFGDFFIDAPQCPGSVQWFD